MKSPNGEASWFAAFPATWKTTSPAAGSGALHTSAHSIRPSAVGWMPCRVWLAYCTPLGAACRACHFDGKLNAAGGALSISGLPEFYLPGSSIGSSFPSGGPR